MDVIQDRLRQSMIDKRQVMFNENKSLGKSSELTHNPIPSQAEFTLGNHPEQGSTLNIASQDSRQGSTEYQPAQARAGGHADAVKGGHGSDPQRIKSAQFPSQFRGLGAARGPGNKN